MSSKVLPQAIADRLSIALTFAFVGPFIGSVAMFIAIVIAALASLNTGADYSSALPFIAAIFFMGYIFGFGPALIAGLVYALLPGALQRLMLAPFPGAGAVWIFFEILGATANSGLSANMSTEPMMLGAGAIASFACAWIARRSGWTPDHRSAAAAA